jgi:HEAT repeats
MWGLRVGSDPTASLGAADVVLRWVWQMALVLSIAAIAIAFGLTFKRWLEERTRTRKVIRQEEITRLVNAVLASPREPDPTSLPPLEPGDESALLSVALNILRVTRGRDAARMLTLLQIWNLRPYLAKVLRKGRRNRKIRVLTILSYFRDAESLDLMLEYIEDKGIYVQLAALRGVADRGHALNLPLVVKALSKARETNVPLLADILRRFGPEAVPALAGLAQGNAVVGVRLAAVSALGGIGSLQAFDDLQALSRDAVPGVRVRALEALAHLGDPRAEDAVQRGLVDHEERVRAAAAIAAGSLGLREVLPSLADALNDESWTVRYRSADALYRLGAPGVAVLRAIALDFDPETETPDPGPAMALELLAEKEGIPA